MIAVSLSSLLPWGIKMSKVLGAVFDCYDDVRFVNHVYAKALYGDELIEPSELTKVADKDFAVKIIEGRNVFRKFPTYNPTITKVSCAYFLANRENLPEEVEKSAGYHLKLACSDHKLGTPDELKAYEPTLSQVKLEADRTIPEIHDAEELAKTAAALLVNQFHYMTPEDRVASAEELSKVAAIEDQRIWDYVPKADYGPRFKEGIAERWQLIKSGGDDQDPLWAIFKTLLTSTYKTSTPLEFAVELAQFDKLAGFRSRYHDGLRDPYYLCFAGFPTPVATMAKEASHNVMLSRPYLLDSGGACSNEMSKQADVESHVAGLRETFPKGGSQYKQAASVVLTDEQVADWGEDYAFARRLYFKQK